VILQKGNDTIYKAKSDEEVEKYVIHMPVLSLFKAQAMLLQAARINSSPNYTIHANRK